MSYDDGMSSYADKQEKVGAVKRAAALFGVTPTYIRRLGLCNKPIRKASTPRIPVGKRKENAERMEKWAKMVILGQITAKEAAFASGVTRETIRNHMKRVAAGEQDV